jgi:serine/threonine-protein kinase RsbW
MPLGFQDVHLAIHSTLDALDLVQVVTEHIAARVGLDEEGQHWTGMAVRETAINAIVHGNKNDTGKRVFIDFAVTPRTSPTDLIVCVRDQGAGFDHEQIDNPLAAENVLRSSGRGIFLIKQFMDEVTIGRSSDGGTEVRMRKQIRASSHA